MQRMILQIAATMLFPVSDKQRAEGYCGRGARKKEKVGLKRAQKEAVKNVTVL